MKPCERVELDFIANAPYRFVSTVDLPVTPEQVWEVLDDAESWPHWATVITKVTWTSPQPHGVGTTRVVNMRGGITGDEEYLAWEPYVHKAFGSMKRRLQALRRSPRTTASHPPPTAVS